MWASLLKGKTAVIEEVAKEMDRRDPSRSATRLAFAEIILMLDGDSAGQEGACDAAARLARHPSVRHVILAPGNPIRCPTRKFAKP